MTAASVLGYVATHEEVAVPAPVAPRVQPAGDVAPVRPEGQAIAPPQAAASPRYDLRAAGGEEPYVPGRETRGRCK